WLAFGLFVVVGTTSGIRLSGSVRKVARDFEEAAAIVGEQRDRLRAVMTTMHDALIVVDARGCVTMANDAACTLFGCREAELIGSPLARYVDGGTGWPSKSAEVRNERITFLARSGAARVPRPRAAILRGVARDHQRGARPFEDRGRQAAARSRAVQPSPDGPRRARRNGDPRRREEARAGGRRALARARCGGRR